MNAMIIYYYINSKPLFHLKHLTFMSGSLKTEVTRVIITAIKVTRAMNAMMFLLHVWSAEASYGWQ
jgi:hypothetical protein